MMLKQTVVKLAKALNCTVENSMEVVYNNEYTHYI